MRTVDDKHNCPTSESALTYLKLASPRRVKVSGSATERG